MKNEAKTCGTMREAWKKKVRERSGKRTRSMDEFGFSFPRASFGSQDDASGFPGIPGSRGINGARETATQDDRRDRISLYAILGTAPAPERTPLARLIASKTRFIFQELSAVTSGVRCALEIVEFAKEARENGEKNYFVPR